MTSLNLLPFLHFGLDRRAQGSTSVASCRGSRETDTSAPAYVARATSTCCTVPRAAVVHVSPLLRSDLLTPAHARGCVLHARTTATSADHRFHDILRESAYLIEKRGFRSSCRFDLHLYVNQPFTSSHGLSIDVPDAQSEEEIAAIGDVVVVVVAILLAVSDQHSLCHPGHLCIRHGVCSGRQQCRIWCSSSR